MPVASMKNSHTFLALGGFVILAAVIATFITAPQTFTGFSVFGGSGTVAVGDLVSVEYVGSLENGTVFDTSRMEVAQSAGIYNPARPYEPISFTVGVQQMIQGFDEAVQGMRVGQEKTVTIPSEKAYGEYDPTRLIVTPRTEVLNRTSEVNKTIVISTAQFSTVFGSQPVVGEVYNTPQAPWPFKVSVADDEKVVLTAVAKVGDKVSLPGTSWDSTVTNVGDNIRIRQDPKPGQMVETPFGNATIELTQREIRIVTNPQKGTVISTLFGQSVVKDVNATSITLDVNHPLAGKTLVFDIEVVGLNKTTA